MVWWQILMAVGASGIFGGAVATFIRTRPAMMLAQMQADGPLWARIGDLEARVSSLQQGLASEQVKVSDLEHELLNERWSFDLFLEKAAADPSKIGEMIPRIIEDRRQHRERLALKRGAREGQTIAAAGEQG